MRPLVLVVVLIMSAAFTFVSGAAAQPVTPPTIQRVTLHPDTGVLTISGSGFGADVIVIVDGQAATVLPSATATQVEVAAPATILTTPGTYRLTVVDPARQVGDAFIVASAPQIAGAAAMTRPDSIVLTETQTAASGAATAVTRRSTVSPVATTSPQYVSAPAPLTVIEDSGFPYRTAIGYQALFSNTLGSYNTASGHQALRNNTTGDDNTASGAHALSSNTTASANTASGAFALFSSTTGLHNTASGAYALTSNTTGSANTASGFGALGNNTTGSYNTGNGDGALFANSTGGDNSASGYQALYSNTTGNFNTANGYFALHSNTTGPSNTASGVSALYANTTGANNTALGMSAGFNSETGSYNIFLGARVVGAATDTNTIRIGLPYDSGTGAGQNKTFIAGIRGTQLTQPAVQVFIDASGQLGTLTPPIVTGTLTAPVLQLQQQVSAQQKQLRDQHTTILELQRQHAELRTRIAQLEALLLARPAGRK